LGCQDEDHKLTGILYSMSGKRIHSDMNTGKLGGAVIEMVAVIAPYHKSCNFYVLRYCSPSRQEWLK
jgi:hypothetical protein